MKRLIFVMLLCVILPLQAQATVLWDQAPISSTGTVDQEFPDYPNFNTYQVNDVTVNANGWTINSITEYFGNFFSAGWPSGTTAPVRLNIFTKIGPLPGAGDDPTAGTQYMANFSYDSISTLTTVTLDGLNINLTAGDYWIGMTPILSDGTYGQEFHRESTTVIGNYTAILNPSGSDGF